MQLITFGVQSFGSLTIVMNKDMVSKNINRIYLRVKVDDSSYGCTNDTKT